MASTWSAVSLYGSTSRGERSPVPLNRDVEPIGPQCRYHGRLRSRKLRGRRDRGEKINVLRYSVDESLCLDRVPAGKAETVVGRGG